MDFDITKEERLYLQNMARRYGEYAELDVMKKRTALWFSHNRLDSERPVVVVENETFNEDFLLLSDAPLPWAVSSKGFCWRRLKTLNRLTTTRSSLPIFRWTPR